MSNYTKTTNFASKDNLSPGNPLKIVKGTEIDTEFNNIQTAVGTKTDNASANITGGTIVGITDLAVADGGTGASTAAGGLNNLLPTQTGNANKYLQTDGTNATWDAVSLSTADITGTLPVLNGGTGVTTSTGTGSVVLSNSPTLVTPALGTPASGTATNLTGLPISTGVSGLGSGVATFLGTPSSANLASAVTDETGSGALVFANSPTLVTPALGTPSALVGTNITGTASGLTAGNVTTNANLTGAVTSVGNATSLGSFSSANLLAALTDETGTGANVFATSPTLVTPILGTPTSATLTNATGLPIATGVSGLGTGVATALAVNVGSSGAPVVNGGALGTPSGGTATNLTGLPLTTGVTGLLPVANGGTGTATPSLVQGTNITITGTWPNQTIAAAGGGGSGDVVGPSSATDNALVRFDTTTGKLVQNSVGILSDTGAISGLTDISASGSVTLSGGTANGVTYLNGSKVLTSGSALVFDGTNLGVGVASPTKKLDILSNTSQDGIRISGSANPRLTIIDTTTPVQFDALCTDTEAVLRTDTNHPLVFSTNGTERMRLDSAGNLGLGVTPTSIQSGYKAIQIGATVGGGIVSAGTDTYFTNNAYVTGGAWYFGSTGYATYYNQSGGVHSWTTSTASGSGGGVATMTERARITSDGNFLVGTTSVISSGKQTISYNGSVNGLIISESANTSNTTFLGFSNGSTIIGSVSRVGATSAVVYNTTSDYRLKTVTGSVTGQGARIDALKPVDYVWTEGSQQARGFLAHEFQSVYPNSVSGDKDAVDANGNPKYQAMQAATSEVIADLVAEIQSLRQRLSAANL